MAIDIRNAQLGKSIVLFVITLWLLFGCVILSLSPSQYYENSIYQITKKGADVGLVVVTAYLAMELITEGSVRAEMGYFDDPNVRISDKIGAGFLFTVGIVLGLVAAALVLTHCSSCAIVIHAQITQGEIPTAQAAEIAGSGKDSGFFSTWDAYFGKRKKGKYKYKKKGKGKGKKKGRGRGKGRRKSRFGFGLF